MVKTTASPASPRNRTGGRTNGTINFQGEKYDDEVRFRDVSCSAGVGFVGNVDDRST